MSDAKPDHAAWLKSLKVGDEVALKRQIANRDRYDVRKIAEISDESILLYGNCPFGIASGDFSARPGFASIVPLTAEVLAEIQARDRRDDVWRRIANSSGSSLTDSQLARIVAILEEKEGGE